MSGTRALIASIGASVLLVAAAALSLLGVSAVFAFGGWSDPVAQSGDQRALILSGGDGGSSSDTRTKALVLPARERSRPADSAARPSSSPQRGRSGDGDAVMQSATRRRPRASYEVTAPAAQTTEPSAPAAPKPSAGDGVRSAGEGLKGTVQSTGDALAQLTDPLLPPLTGATQEVLDVVAELLRRTTNGLGGTVDGLLAPQ